MFEKANRGLKSWRPSFLRNLTATMLEQVGKAVAVVNGAARAEFDSRRSSDDLPIVEGLLGVGNLGAPRRRGRRRYKFDPSAALLLGTA